MLTVHHLGRSQSDRIVWICEELKIPYELKVYTRDPSGAAPPAYKALHILGAAPVIQDGDLTMAESGAIVEYLCRKYGKGRFLIDFGAANYADFVYWFHFANATFMPSFLMVIFAGADAAPDRAKLLRRRMELCFETVERRLEQQPYLAGPEFTAADLMMLFPLTTMRLFVPHDLAQSPRTLAYLQRIAARPALKLARQKGDPDLDPKLT
jgi:glutathione S-transferase